MVYNFKYFFKVHFTCMMPPISKPPARCAMVQTIPEIIDSHIHFSYLNYSVSLHQHTLSQLNPYFSVLFPQTTTFTIFPGSICWGLPFFQTGALNEFTVKVLAKNVMDSAMSCLVFAIATRENFWESSLVLDANKETMPPGAWGDMSVYIL